MVIFLNKKGNSSRHLRGGRLLVPLFLGNVIKAIAPGVAPYAQLIVGSIVNATLIMTALNLKGWAKTLGVVTMPSLSTILSGYLFTSASTIYMMWMIPAIWVGNFLLCYMMKYVASKKMKYFASAFIGIVLKLAVIALSFLALKTFMNIPMPMAGVLETAMTMTQAYTAIIGSLIAYLIYKAEMKKA